MAEELEPDYQANLTLDHNTFEERVYFAAGHDDAGVDLRSLIGHLDIKEREQLVRFRCVRAALIKPREA
jgi:hypothetical protein